MIKDDEIDFSKLPGFDKDAGMDIPDGKLTLGFEDGTTETLIIPEADPITEEHMEALKKLLIAFSKFKSK